MIRVPGSVASGSAGDSDRDYWYQPRLPQTNSSISHNMGLNH